MPMWTEISEHAYNEALEVLPPALVARGGFLIGEPTDHVPEGPRFGAYLERGDRYWSLTEPLTVAQMRNVLSGALSFPFDEKELPDVKCRALAAHFGVPADTINEEPGDLYSCDSEPGEYAVMTDEEADEAWDEELDRYIDECLEIPEAIRPYFDEEKWKADARHDGRGHCLSSYDGNEHEVQVDGEWFYIYRTN